MVLDELSPRDFVSAKLSDVRHNVVDAQTDLLHAVSLSKRYLMVFKRQKIDGDSKGDTQFIGPCVASPDRCAAAVDLRRKLVIQAGTFELLQQGIELIIIR